MAVHEVALVGRECVAEATMAFRFKKPVGFSHRAGQSLTMTLIDPPESDSEGNARTFTIASAPYEADLMIATRMRDTAFKRILKTAPLGMRVTIDGPDGQMVLHEDPARPAVMLAGGIGVTPFRAMTMQATHERLPHRLYLFYSSRHLEDAAFLSELLQLQEVNPNFRLITTLSEPRKSSHRWSGETGFIQRDMLKRHVPDLDEPLYYFAGPPTMTAAMQQMLETIGIDEQAMRYEEFYGY